MDNMGCGSNLDVNNLLSQIEELKLKVATNEERVFLYEEQIMDLKKMLVKEENQSQPNSEVVVELRKKIAKQHTKTNTEQKMVKVLECIVVFLWGLLIVVTIEFAMKYCFSRYTNVVYSEASIIIMTCWWK